MDNTLSTVKQSIISLDGYAQSHGVCIAGETGTGVSHALLQLIHQDNASNKRVILIDPYGDLIAKLRKTKNEIEVWRIGSKDSAYYFDLFRTNEPKPDSYRIAEEIISHLYSFFDPDRTGILGPRFENAVRNTIVAVLDAHQGSFTNIVRALTDETYLQTIIPQITHSSVHSYFTQQLAQTSDFHKSEILDYIVSKLSMFIDKDSIVGNVLLGSNRKEFADLLSSKSKLIALDLSALLNQPFHVQRLIYQLMSKEMVKTIHSYEDSSVMNASLYIDEADRLNPLDFQDISFLSRRKGMCIIYTVRSPSLLSPQAQYSYFAGRSIISFRLPPPDAKVLAPYLDTFKKPEEISLIPNFHYVGRVRSKNGVEFAQSEE